MARKATLFCRACGEPTTHERKIVEGRELYVCLMCEAGKLRGKENLERIKETRKGWRSHGE